MSSRTLLEMFSHIVFTFTRGVAEHYNPDEPEFTSELFGYNALESTGREWNFFPVDEMIYQEYSDRQDTTLDYLPASGSRVRLNDASYPFPLTPGNVMAGCFDRECEGRLLVRVTGRRFAVSRFLHIMRHELQK